jgi:hypothetical protein
MDLASRENDASRARCELKMCVLTSHHAKISRFLRAGVKEMKIGEGTYANVYKGRLPRLLAPRCYAQMYWAL